MESSVHVARWANTPLPWTPWLSPKASFAPMCSRPLSSSLSSQAWTRRFHLPGGSTTSCCSGRMPMRRESRSWDHIPLLMSQVGWPLLAQCLDSLFRQYRAALQEPHIDAMQGRLRLDAQELASKEQAGNWACDASRRAVVHDHQDRADRIRLRKRFSVPPPARSHPLLRSLTAPTT